MKKEILYSILFILISIFLFLRFTFPKQKTVSNLYFQFLQKKKEFESTQRYIKEMQNALEKLKNYQEELAKIDSAIPEDPSIPAVFEFIQKTASKSGLILESVGSFGFVTEGKMKKWTTSFKVKGDYPSLKNFISFLEKSSRLIRINTLSFSGQEKSFSVDFSVSFFSY